MMAGGKPSLTDVQNGIIRALALRVQREKGWTITRLAAAVGLTQGQMSRFLDNKGGTSYDAALRIGELAGMTPEGVWAALGKARAPAPTEQIEAPPLPGSAVVESTRPRR